MLCIGHASAPTYVRGSSRPILLPTPLHAHEVIRPVVEQPTRYLTAPVPPGIESNIAARPMPQALAVAPLIAPPSHHLPPPGVPLGPPPLLRSAVQMPVVQAPPLLPPGIAHPAGRSTVIAGAPAPTYPFPGTITLLKLTTGCSCYSLLDCHCIILTSIVH